MRFIVLIGITLDMYLGDTSFVIENGFLTLQMSKLALLSYPFIIFAIVYSLKMKPVSTEIEAPWWRGFTSFFIDFYTIVSLVFTPICFIGLVIENKGIPVVWCVARELSSHENVVYSTLLFPSILIALALLSSFLHPRIVSPGQLLANVTITKHFEEPNNKLLMYGFMSYFLVAFPFTLHFIPSHKEKKRMEPDVVIRCA
ncbi:hypothetical protein Q4561_02485 [Alteromonas sp. 1_MG-2023]|uniref:hypothetical protein n=1 Tax=Alteromonas sp. 1_MG-2023 TaxID=3062669 RepID=UPI0026E1D482|nr:hypothetical protein [Alteromonas sp. 1_MG-2023]MDO6565917.1 hypothetical protein [Alteromonas sp. 1_MG-2023]